MKIGNPNGARLPDWHLAYHSTGAWILMDFTNNGPVAKADPWKKRLDLDRTDRLSAKGTVSFSVLHKLVSPRMDIQRRPSNIANSPSHSLKS